MSEKEKSESIFREKSMEKVSSPEALGDYIRVTKPSVWIFLIALVLLLCGMLAWSVFGRIEVRGEDGNVEQIAPISYVLN